MKDRELILMLGELKGVVSSAQSQLMELSSELKKLSKDVQDNAIKQTNYMAVDLGEHKSMNNAQQEMSKELADIRKLIQDRIEQESSRDKKIITASVVISGIIAAGGSQHDKLMPALLSVFGI
jgi:dTDP-glucose pyrophosphorylase